MGSLELTYPLDRSEKKDEMSGKPKIGLVAEDETFS